MPQMYMYIVTFTIKYAFLSRESDQGMSRCERDLLKFPLWVFGCKFPRLQHFLDALINQSVVSSIRVYTANSSKEGANSDLGVSQDAIRSTSVRGALDCHLNKSQTRGDGSTSSGAIQRGPRIKTENISTID